MPLAEKILRRWNYFGWGVLNAVLVVGSPGLLLLIKPTNRWRRGILIFLTLTFTFLGQLLLMSPSAAKFFANTAAVFSIAQIYSPLTISAVGLSVFLFLFNKYDQCLYAPDKGALSKNVFYGLVAFQLVFVIFFHKSGASFLYADF